MHSFMDEWYVCTWNISHKNEILPPVTVWVDLKGIILSEISQTEKGKHHMIFLQWGLSKWINLNDVCISIEEMSF